jgi:hypothetical protein
MRCVRHHREVLGMLSAFLSAQVSLLAQVKVFVLVEVAL